ncbi:asialoglycoprotein receptor 1-like [Triplophysa rosa]|uniref:asialoglycoprotein receptor 1-like n=1 Tax=Triplophysa rosa TaxID=992332 RepID=UPI002545CEFE|nr:asialoglycoprotein receptor 1-like [Triplophysa rosa]
MSGSVNDSIDKRSTMDREEKEERIVDIYITAEAVRDIKHKKQTEESKTTTTTQPSEHKGSECVRNRRPRSVLVCLVVLCVLLLTAVIVLCVLIYTNNHQFHINYKNITQDRDQLLTKYTKLTDDRDQLITKYIKITEEKDQLLNKYTKLTEERNELTTKYYNATELYIQLNRERNTIWTHLCDGWIHYEVSLYFISSEKKSWSESLSYCRVRGADLFIINNKDEQVSETYCIKRSLGIIRYKCSFVSSKDFVKKITCGEHVWIGLSDSDEEGRWKWVDGSTLTSGFSFWRTAIGEPGGSTTENCAVSHSGWDDISCASTFKSICEKKIF